MDGRGYEGYGVRVGKDVSLSEWLGLFMSGRGSVSIVGRVTGLMRSKMGRGGGETWKQGCVSIERWLGLFMRKRGKGGGKGEGGRRGVSISEDDSLRAKLRMNVAGVFLSEDCLVKKEL